MGQKIHPKSLRLGIIATWDSTWFARGADYIASLRHDQGIKIFLRTRLKEAGCEKIEIQRTPQSVTIVAHVARPGIIIGKGGAGAEQLRSELMSRFFPQKKGSFHINVVEVSNPNLSAGLLMQEMINDIEKRLPFRRVMKHTIDKVKKAGAKGVKVQMGGRLDGAEIARRETLSYGSFPLHTLRADIDYTMGTAHTIYGTIGVKVWVYKGEVFAK